jgi:hypothetical protein
MLIDPSSVGFVVCPLAFINISVDMAEFSDALSSVFSPVAHEPSTVRPGLLTPAVSEASFPLAAVDSPSFEDIRGPFFSFLVGIVHIFSHSFFALFISEIF